MQLVFCPYGMETGMVDVSVIISQNLPHHQLLDENTLHLLTKDIMLSHNIGGKLAKV